ncbi:MAG: ABC transporter permease [Bacteroidota bacterium]|jgi:lipopolysaccharide transport system permease protein
MKKENWDLIIRPHQRFFDLNLREVWRYRDLVMQFVRRDIVAVYKQTLLGPVWFIVQPILTTIVFTFVFGNLAGLAPDNVPAALFYMSGIIPWNYFSECLIKTSTTFTGNASIYGKVYFPRLVMPFSVVISNMAKLGIQLVILAMVWLYYYLKGGYDFQLSAVLMLLPVVIIIMAGLGLSLGILISSLTTKYRDFAFLVVFGVELLKFASTLIFPLILIKNETYRTIIYANPMTSIIETFRFALMGKGAEFNPMALLYSGIFMVVVFLFSALLFNRVEKSFMDTV